MEEKYVKVERIKKWINDRIEDYVDEAQELIREEKQEGFIYRNRVKVEAYEDFIEKLEYLKKLLDLEGFLHGKKED